jgi:CspA family cold shock protein
MPARVVAGPLDAVGSTRRAEVGRLRLAVGDVHRTATLDARIRNDGHTVRTEAEVVDREVAQRFQSFVEDVLVDDRLAVVTRLHSDAQPTKCRRGKYLPPPAPTAAGTTPTAAGRGTATLGRVIPCSALLLFVMANGKVDFFNDTGGYGFISTDDGDLDDDEDVFFHMEDVGGPDLEEGEEVEFDIESSPKGPRAANLVRK